MYENLQRNILGNMTKAAAAFYDHVSVLTNEQILDSSFYSRFLVDKIRKQLIRENPKSIVSDEVAKNMTDKYRFRTVTEFDSYMRNIMFAAKCQAATSFTVSTKWKTEMGKMTYYANVRTANHRSRGKSSGDGYNKQGAAIARAMNGNPEIMKIFYDRAEAELGFDVKGVIAFDNLFPIPIIMSGVSAGILFKLFKSLGFSYTQNVGENGDRETFLFIKKEDT